MARRPAPARVTDDRYFPVRVRIAIPEGGFGEQLNVMHGWLTVVSRSRMDASLKKPK